MARFQEFTYSSADGVHAVHAAQWLPDEEPPRAVVQLVHGVSEYIMRYDHFANYLAAQGIAVVGGDLLGHGATASGAEEYGFLGEKNGWRYLADDVRALRVLTGETFPGVPYFLMGHSLGSFLVRLYLIEWPGTVNGAILSGTGQESGFLVAFGKWLSGVERRRLGPKGHSPLLNMLSLDGYNKSFAPARTRADWISRDTAVVDAYVADPLCSFYPTVSMLQDMMDGLWAIARGETLRKMDGNTPVYFFSGACDPVGQRGAGVKKVYRLFERAGCKDLNIRLYPEGRHEMLNEINRDEVYHDVLDWLELHLAAAPVCSPND